MCIKLKIIEFIKIKQYIVKLNAVTVAPCARENEKQSYEMMKLKGNNWCVCVCVWMDEFVQLCIFQIIMAHFGMQLKSRFFREIQLIWMTPITRPISKWLRSWDAWNIGFHHLHEWKKKTNINGLSLSFINEATEQLHLNGRFSLEINQNGYLTFRSRFDRMLLHWRTQFYPTA